MIAPFTICYTRSRDEETCDQISLVNTSSGHPQTRLALDSQGFRCRWIGDHCIREVGAHLRDKLVALGREQLHRFSSPCLACSVASVPDLLPLGYQGREWRGSMGDDEGSVAHARQRKNC